MVVGRCKNLVVNLWTGNWGGNVTRSDFLEKEELKHLLAALTPPNRLACELSLATGLRIGDVLALCREQLEEGSQVRVVESKTGKARRVRIPDELRRRGLMMAGQIFVFENRRDPRRHRTRQAVYKDLRRAAVLFRVKEHVSPHTARKTWAVEVYRRHRGDLRRVQKLLQHESEAVTMLYAMADVLTDRRLGRRKN